MTAVPKTHYAKGGDLHIASPVTGQGPLDLVWMPGFVSHLERRWEHPWRTRLLERQGSFSPLMPGDGRRFAVSPSA